MDSFLQAALLFWLPLLCIPLGSVFAMSRKDGTRPVVGWSVAGIGLVMVMLSWLTVPDSDSTAGGHLLLAVIGPALMMAMGCFLLIFSGKVPVRRFPSHARPVGVLSVLIGLLWLLMMHIENPPVWRQGVNPYWVVWWPAFLLSVLAFSSFVIGAFLMVGENRKREAAMMSIFTLFFLGLLSFIVSYDGSLTTAEEMRSQLWLSVADLLGTVLGIVAAVLTVAIVIARYERSLPPLGVVPPLTTAEVELASEHIANNLRGEEE